MWNIIKCYVLQKFFKCLLKYMAKLCLKITFLNQGLRFFFVHFLYILNLANVSTLSHANVFMLDDGPQLAISNCGTKNSFA